MKKTINFRIVIIKLLTLTAIFFIPMTSYYSFDQTIPSTALYTLLAISVLGNFYSPLHFNCSSQLKLIVDIADFKFQPIYITKQNGITESINALFTLDKNPDRIEKIEFYVIKYSGLLNHKIIDIQVNDEIEDGIELIFKMRFFTFKANKPLLLIKDLPSEVQKKFLFDKNKPFEIYTKANYGLLHQLRMRITKWICDLSWGKYPLNQNGSICNIKCIHSKIDS